MATAQGTQPPFWLVIDIRTAQEGINSGVSRFVVGLTTALVKELAALKTTKMAQNSALSRMKILLIAKREPPAWVVDLVNHHPSVVTFWSGGPGALSKRWDKPVYYWPTRVFSRIAHFTKGNFLWLAPANFDRPLLFSALFRSRNRNRIMQVVHDGIPFLQSKSMGFLFRTQFSFLVRRSLNLLPLVFTVSEHSAGVLQQVSNRREKPIMILGNGIEPLFGSTHRPTQHEKQQARVAFLRSVAGTNLSPEKEKMLEALSGMRWVIGVGRFQKYKGWELAEEAVSACHNQFEEGVLFIRVGYESKEKARHQRQGEGGELASNLLLYPQARVLGISHLNDAGLSEIYRLSDVLIHPSKAEGFGLPPLEAALSGLPVLFRRGTAVEAHFAPDVLPHSAWHGMASDQVQDWVGPLLMMLQGDVQSKAYFEAMKKAENPRDFVLQISEKSTGKRFSWKASAQTLLAQIHHATAQGQAPKVSDGPNAEA